MPFVHLDIIRANKKERECCWYVASLSGQLLHCTVKQRTEVLLRCIFYWIEFSITRCTHRWFSDSDTSTVCMYVCVSDGDKAKDWFVYTQCSTNVPSQWWRRCKMEVKPIAWTKANNVHLKKNKKALYSWSSTSQYLWLTHNTVTPDGWKSGGDTEKRGHKE